MTAYDTDLEMPRFVHVEKIRHVTIPRKTGGKWHFHIPKYFEPKEKQPRKKIKKTSVVSKKIYMALSTRPCNMRELMSVSGSSKSAVEKALKEIKTSNRVFTICAGKDITYELAK